MYDPLQYADACYSEVEYFYDVYHPSLKEIYEMFLKKDINQEQFNELKDLAEKETEL